MSSLVLLQVFGLNAIRAMQGLEPDPMVRMKLCKSNLRRALHLPPPF